MKRSTFSMVFLLSCCTVVMGQPGKHSDTTYHISRDKHASVPPTPDSSSGKGVAIQNSLPKGGRYTDPRGKVFGYAIFWSRVINKTGFPLELTINFPADSFAVSPEPGHYLKILLPTDTMTSDKGFLYDYGATGLKSFLDTSFHKPAMLQRTIGPEEEYLFYVVILIRLPESGFVRPGFVLRPGFFLKDQELYYRIGAAGQPDLKVVPCGQIVFKK